MPFLQDPGSTVWQMGITTLGQLTTAVYPHAADVPILRDELGSYWSIGVTTLGQLTTTSTGAALVWTILLIDSNLTTWQVTVNSLGQLLTTITYPVTYPNDMTPGTGVAWRFR